MTTPEAGIPGPEQPDAVTPTPKAIAAWLAKALDAIGRLLERPAVAYTAVLVLQLKVLWGAWRTRDLAFGDTASYYQKALSWFHHGTVDIAWSPAYTAFLGSFLHIADDPYFATIAHRVVIALALSALVLAVMRRLLSPTVAWLVAAWWATNPANYDAMYEVHMFAFVPVLLSIVLVGLSRSVAMRAAGLAVLAASIILVRNELVVSTACLFLLCWWWEARQRRGASWRVVAAYALALVVAAAVCGWFYERSFVKFPALWEHMQPKHTVNMGQVFAFGYQQRHPEWTSSPWLEFSPLMEANFGRPQPTFLEMVGSNPSAVLDHFRWNIRLTPSGLQLLVFNQCSGSVTPDYTASIHEDSRAAVLLSLLTISVVAGGLFLLLRSHRLRPLILSDERVLVWGSMLAVVIVMPLVILTQRPRPEYLYPLALPIMALVGVSVDELVRRHRGNSGMARLMNLSVAIVLVTSSGGHYFSGTGKSRPILDRYRVLEPFRDLLAGQTGTVLVDTAASELASYLSGPDACASIVQVLDYGSIAPLMSDGNASGALDALGVGVLYLTPAFPGTPPGGTRALRDSLVTDGWSLVGLRESRQESWCLLLRK